MVGMETEGEDEEEEGVEGEVLNLSAAVVPGRNDPVSWVVAPPQAGCALGKFVETKGDDCFVVFFVRVCENHSSELFVLKTNSIDSSETNDLELAQRDSGGEVIRVRLSTAVLSVFAWRNLDTVPGR
ncbi:hypothetical protein JOB18_003881 [Solea senegalensis]|uniref:Uncharacterized protein n=1 Tax=Solea senegalensis TaxID=28829 RepID=A0AAV6Q6D9_SOLSE|nr:hypothetical protein JOB18_003881 [Solea senegalensis]